MVLSRQTIIKLLKSGSIKINPFSEKNLGNCSYDLHLGSKAVFPKDGRVVEIKKSFYILPGEFVLVETEEYLSIPGFLVGHLSARSSAAKIGLLVNLGSDLVHPQTSGKLTIEVKNLSEKEVLLQEGLSLTQIYFEKLDAPVEGGTIPTDNTASKLCEEIVG